ncbi:MAG: hypothetical protein Q4F56_02675 [Candidatus Saccharibacteria bacterium]|nr:hypothetical protein [Candidatus Saccharibacteria bacterium]
MARARAKTSKKKNLNSRVDDLISPAEDGHQFITVVLAIVFSSLVSACVAALLSYSIAARSFRKPTPVYLVTPPEDVSAEETTVVTDTGETVVTSDETTGM